MSQLSGSAYPAWQRSPYLEPRQPQWVDTVFAPPEMVTPAGGLCISLAEAKLQCRVDNSAEDALVTGLIYVSQEWCERQVEGELQLLSAAYNWPLRGFWYNTLRLQRPPIQNATVTYYDPNGVVQTLDPTLYTVHYPWRQPARLERLPYMVFPVTQSDRQNPVQVSTVCGHGPNTSIAVAVSAGAQTVTPATMFGIYVGTTLIVDTGLGQETITVTGVASTTFTATFRNAHPAGVQVYPGIPQTVRQAILFTVASYYRNREPPDGKDLDCIERLLGRAGYGSYG